MTKDQARDQLTPTLTVMGARFINAAKKRELYVLGGADMAALATRLLMLLNQDDPRWVGMAELVKLLQMTAASVGLPQNPQLGMEPFYERDKPLPLPQANIEKMADGILDYLDKSRGSVPAPK